MTKVHPLSARRGDFWCHPTGSRASPLAGCRGCKPRPIAPLPVGRGAGGWGKAPQELRSSAPDECGAQIQFRRFPTGSRALPLAGCRGCKPRPIAPSPQGRGGGGARHRRNSGAALRMSAVRRSSFADFPPGQGLCPWRGAGAASPGLKPPPLWGGGMGGGARHRRNSGAALRMSAVRMKRFLPHSDQNKNFLKNYQLPLAESGNMVYNISVVVRNRYEFIGKHYAPQAERQKFT